MSTATAIFAATIGSYLGLGHLVRDSGSFVVGLTREKPLINDPSGALDENDKPLKVANPAYDAEAAQENLEFLQGLDWSECTDSVPEGARFGTCIYFSAPVPEDVQAFEGVVRFGSLTAAQKASCRVRVAEHKDTDRNDRYEIVSPTAIDPVQVDVIVMAVGDLSSPFAKEHETQVVYFWAPGRVMTPLEVHKVEGIEVGEKIPPELWDAIEDATVKHEG